MSDLFIAEGRSTSSVQPQAFKELDASRYIGTNRTYFREIVAAGKIPFTEHFGKKTRLYLREDLDAYLHGLKKRTMGTRENPLIAVKGVSR